MVVKDRVGRSRYILYELAEDPPSRREVGRLIGQRAWRLTVYEDGWGILRVPHTEVAQARAFIEQMGGRPVTTSGTILKAKKVAGLS